MPQPLQISSPDSGSETTLSLVHIGHITIIPGEEEDDDCVVRSFPRLEEEIESVWKTGLLSLVIGHRSIITFPHLTHHYDSIQALPV